MGNNDYQSIKQNLLHNIHFKVYEFAYLSRMEEEEFLYYDLELTVKYQESQIMLSIQDQLLIFDFFYLYEDTLPYTKFYLN